MEFVFPGQPIEGNTDSFHTPGSTYLRSTHPYSSTFSSTSTTRSITPVLPHPNAIIIGSITRMTRTEATVTILTVGGQTCRGEFMGVIRAQDVRQIAKEGVKVWDWFRPGDVVRAKVVRSSLPSPL